MAEFISFLKTVGLFSGAMLVIGFITKWFYWKRSVENDLANTVLDNEKLKAKDEAQGMTDEELKKAIVDKLNKP